MSTWYQAHMTAISEDKSPIANFFNLNDDSDDVRINNFTISFGCKNGPGLNFLKILKLNPKLIFLTNWQIECNTSRWCLDRYDQVSDKYKSILIQDIDYFNVEFNKKILEDYSKEYPTLLEKHLSKEKGFECFRWEMFFNDFDKCAKYLDQEEQYLEMVTPLSKIDIELDNDYSHLAWDNDYSHLE